jgi:hypothetical protein
MFKEFLQISQKTSNFLKLFFNQKRLKSILSASFRFQWPFLSREGEGETVSPSKPGRDWMDLFFNFYNLFTFYLLTETQLSNRS